MAASNQSSLLQATYHMLEQQAGQKLWLQFGLSLGIYSAIEGTRILFHKPTIQSILVSGSAFALLGIATTAMLHRIARHSIRHTMQETQRTTQAEQERAQLEAAQATAVTVAHTLSQPLTIISGYAELLLGGTLSDQENADLRQIMQETRRAGEFLRQLQSINRYVTTTSVAGVRMLDLSAAQEDFSI